ncbi:MAG: DUF2393 family protein [Acidobacteriaceae bacterium]
MALDNDNKSTPEIFAPEPPQGRNWKAICIGIALVAIVIALLAMFAAKQQPQLNAANPNSPGVAAGYAPNLPLTDVKMSSADIGTGAEIYYVTGKVRNTGARTLTGATVELVFHDSLGNICQRNTEPLRVVVATEPAVDTTDLAHAPLKPGQSQDFQIPIEHISAQWDGQYPTLTVVAVSTK